MEVNYKVLGYLNEIAFTAYLKEFLEGYSNKLNGVDELNFKAEELSYARIPYDDSVPFVISDDRKIIDIHYSYYKYYDTSGRVTGRQTNEAAYSNLKELFNRICSEYSNN